MRGFPYNNGEAGAQYIGLQFLQVIFQLLELAAVSFTYSAHSADAANYWYTVTQVGAYEFALYEEKIYNIAVLRKPVSIPATIIAVIKPLLLPPKTIGSSK
jgi:hypothetical protein